MASKLQIFDIKLNALDRHQALENVAEFFNKKSPSLICTVNVEFVTRSFYDLEFKDILNHKSSLNIIDGAGIVWGVVILQSWRPNIPIIKYAYVILQWLVAIILYPVLVPLFTRKISKLSGSDFSVYLADWASKNHKTIFLLGNKYGLDPNVVEKAALEMQTKFYGLKIAGSHSGSADGQDEKTIIELIKKSGADILFCGFGSPSQEIWLAKNLNRTGCKIGIGLGGTFDFIAGVQRRAPRSFQIIGMEWLWRLLSNPRRLKRLPTLIKFVLKILLSLLEIEKSVT